MSVLWESPEYLYNTPVIEAAQLQCLDLLAEFICAGDTTQEILPEKFHTDDVALEKLMQRP